MGLRNVKFLVNDLISGSGLIQNKHNEVQPSKSSDRLVVIHAPLVQEHIRQLVFFISKKKKTYINKKQLGYLNLYTTTTKKCSDFPSPIPT